MEEQEEKVKQMIDELVEKAKIASEEYLKLDQEKVDNITAIVLLKCLTSSLNKYTGIYCKYLLYQNIIKIIIVLIIDFSFSCNFNITSP